jgi:NAD(P)H-hydrate epimerase
MENAAQALVDRIKSLNMVSVKVLIVCGIGNNGGDGLALARLLSQMDMEVEVCIVGDCAKGTESFKVQQKRLDGLPVCFITIENLLHSDDKKYDIVVDAIFGVGLSRDIKGVYADIIEKCNALTAYKLAVDIPSGICANTGKILDVHFMQTVP